MRRFSRAVLFRRLAAGRRCAERIGPVVIVLAAASITAGCAAIASSAASGFASDLSAAIRDQDDPELVREATPAYLVLLDSLARDSTSPDTLGAAAQLYAAYGSLFVSSPERAQTLTARARDYGEQALCASTARACGLDALDFDAYQATIGALPERDADALFSYSVGLLAYIQAHSSNWNALAELPQAEVALQRLEAIAPPAQLADVYKFLGILNSLRPPALGGEPEQGRAYFERALALSGGRDLSVPVEYARGYARLVYDRELFDRLLNSVLEADVRQTGLTLFNTIAQEQARELLATADDYF